MAKRINTPCPHCGREEDGRWFAPCPSDDCPSNDATALLHDAAPDLLAALRVALEAEANIGPNGWRIPYVPPAERVALYRAAIARAEGK